MLARDLADSCHAALDVNLASAAPAWTSKFVKACMVDAFRTLRQIPGSTGPAGYKTGWPTIVRELSDLLNAEDAATTIAKRPPSKTQVTLMEQALRWPARFLLDYPKGADALNLWAACKAYRLGMRGILAQRSKSANAIASVIEKEINAKRADDRKAIAAATSEWAKMRHVLGPRTAEAKERIIANAEIRLERELRKKGILQPTIWVDPADVFPDKVIAETTMEENRDLAAQIIADRLARN